ncbi:hypothetical protein J2S44_007748 [Catenuloplanes niger]|uniref:Uncharacterized protein n=1 Tax=Catenuloplanes niger TaxID=587534 RepID=A0AAE3ZWV1_9ACTN|nr:hypothetical protein [Catenuloplanes niger]
MPTPAFALLDAVALTLRLPRRVDGPDTAPTT